MNLYKRCKEPCEGCQHPLWYRFKHKKRTYRGSTHTTNRKLAGRIATRERNIVVGERAGLEMVDEETKEDEPLPFFSAVRPEYVVWAEGDHPATASDDAWRLQEFQTLLGDRRIDEYAPFDMERWRTLKLKTGVVRNTVIRHEVTIRGFFAKCKIWKGLKLSPFEKKDPDGEPQVKAWKPDDTTRPTLDDDQLAVAFNQMPPFYGLLCRITHETNARLAEGLKLKRTDLLASQIEFTRKGGKRDRVNVTAALLAALRAFCPLNQEYVFPDPNRTDGKPLASNKASANLTREFRKIGLRGFSHHCIRHTGITEMLENGVNPRTIQQYAGWTSLRQMKRYGHARDAEARRAVEAQAAKFKRLTTPKPTAEQPEAEGNQGAHEGARSSERSR